MPITAMKTFKPTEFMNHKVDDGMRPNDGLTERSQPKISPEMETPPAVEIVNGTPLILRTIAPTSAPRVIAAPMNATSATSLARSNTPNTFAAAVVSWVRPTMVRISPR